MTLSSDGRDIDWITPSVHIRRASVPSPQRMLAYIDFGTPCAHTRLGFSLTLNSYPVFALISSGVTPSANSINSNSGPTFLSTLNTASLVMT